MDPEDIKAELKRVYTQLRMFKIKNIYDNNPHISKKKGGAKKPSTNIQTTSGRGRIQSVTYKSRESSKAEPEEATSMIPSSERCNSPEQQPMQTKTLPPSAYASATATVHVNPTSSNSKIDDLTVCSSPQNVYWARSPSKTDVNSEGANGTGQESQKEPQKEPQPGPAVTVVVTTPKLEPTTSCRV